MSLTLKHRTLKNTNIGGVISKTKLNTGWKFINSDVSNAQNISFDDSSWSNVTIPHDWSIYLNFNSSSASGYTGGFLDGGTGWYRLHLNIDSTYTNKQIFLYFDGVYMESYIYVNGTQVATNKHGYTSFVVDITNAVIINSINVIAVKVINQEPSSRWYSGSGIYRNVYLVTKNINTLYIDTYGVTITTPNLSTEVGGNVTVNINTKIINIGITNKAVLLKHTFYNSNGSIFVQHTENVILLNGTNSTNQVFKVPNPILWQVYNGYIYNVTTEIIDSSVVDTKNTRFGFRYISFDANTGFHLNGVWTKINGVCLHHDLGCLGAEVNISAIQRQIRLMKNMGCNAIRTSHNPCSLEFLRICEDEGILVMEEAFDCWDVGKVSNDYYRFFGTYGQNDLQCIINRDKNSPAIILWSIGNEIPDTNTANTVTIAQNLINWVKAIDTTRPITLSCDKYQSGNGADTYTDQIMALMDVRGYNYGDKSYDSQHTLYPNTPLIGTETSSALRSRSVYARDNTNYQCSSRDNDIPTWGASAETVLKNVRNRQFMSGQFIWTGIDYIGEPTPFNAYPTKSSYFGICDLAGFPKDIYYLFQSQWINKPMIHILPHWNYSSYTNIDIWAYTNCNEVELYLNGESQGKRFFITKTTSWGMNYLETSSGLLHLTWIIPYVSGTLYAVGRINGIDTVTTTVQTAGNPYAIKLSSNKQLASIGNSSINTQVNTEDNLIYITADIVDSNGIFCPLANNSVTFSVTGGIIVGVDNGNAASVENFKNTNTRLSFNGKVLCVVKPDNTSSNIVVTATSTGLMSGEIAIPKTINTIINVNGISISESTSTINIGYSHQLNAIVLPSNAINQSIIWNSSDISIVTVSNDGLIFGINTGTATITATTSDGNYTATSIITVTNSPTLVTGITLNLSKCIIANEENKKIYETISPSNATNQNVIWSSSDNNIVSVDQTGLASYVNNGTAIITVTTLENNYTASCMVNAIPISIDSLMLYLDGNDFLNSPQTTIWKDKSKYGNHATIVNIGYNSTSGSDGNGGIILDGTNDYIKNSLINTVSSNNFTIELKCSMLDYGTSWNSLFCITTGTTVVLKMERANSTQLVAQGVCPYTAINFGYGNTLHIIQITVTTTTIVFWLDGIKKTTVSRNTVSGNDFDTLYLGEWNYGGGYASATYDFVRIYGRALSDTEIITNYNASL